MSIEKFYYGELLGQSVDRYVLDNGCGLCAHILTYGGIISKLIYQGVDVVLGRDSLEEYIDNDGYYGALIGRNSNRIRNSQFELGGTIYNLSANDGKNNLHGGKVGFNAKIWNVEETDSEETSLVLSLISPDGEEGFPGNVAIRVKYALTKDNAIVIQYEGVSDKDTILNLTNHSYFNLNGHDSGTIDGHKLWLASDFYTPNDSECIPTGEILSVENTPFDFSTPETLGERFQAPFEQITMFGGFDHNMVLNGNGFRLIGSLKGDLTGTVMEVYTDCRGVQVYSGNAIDENRVCKNGMQYPKHGALCLETQVFPGFTSFSHFPDGYVKANQNYTTRTAYRFLNSNKETNN